LEIEAKTKKATSGKKIRGRVFGFVGALILLSLLTSSLSLLQISQVNSTLDSINRVSLPLNKVFAQMQIDVDVFRREAIRGIGSIHWNDTHWVARPIPSWISEVVESELGRVESLVAQLPKSANGSGAEMDWKLWSHELTRDFTRLQSDGEAIYHLLEKRDTLEASTRFPAWNGLLEDWGKRLQWGIQLHDQSLRDRFTDWQASFGKLRTGLEVIFHVSVGFAAPPGEHGGRRVVRDAHRPPTAG